MIKAKKFMILFIFSFFIVNNTNFINAKETVTNYSTSDYTSDLENYARWSEFLRPGYDDYPIGEGRGGYYIFSPYGFYTETGYCSISLCINYGKNGIEIFNFPPTPSCDESCVLEAYTVTPATYGWYHQVGLDVYVNDVNVGAITSAERGESKVSELEVNCSVFSKTEDNDIFMIYNEPGTSSDLTRIYWVSLRCEDNTPPAPMPTNRSMIIASGEWQHVLSATPVRVPLIVSDKMNGNVQKFMDDYNPDHIYTVGLDLGLNNSHEIVPEDIPSLFFPNETRAVYADTRSRAVLGSQLAYYLGIPLVFDSSGWNPESLIDLSGTTEEEIQELYMQTVKDNDDDIDYLVLANMENDTSLLAGRVAGMRQGYVVPVRLTGISYQGLPPQVNTDNGAETALQALMASAAELHDQGLYSGSPGFRKGEPLYLGIVGDSMSIPYVVMHDPGLEAFNDKDGPLIHTDLFYSDLNQDGYFDVSVGRFPGNLTSTSLQIERMSLPKEEDAVLIGQYRHRKYLDLQLMGGGMMQAYTAQAALDEAGFQTRRIIENRSQPLIDLFPQGVGFKEVYEIIVHRYNLNKLAATSGFVSVVSWVWMIAEGGEVALYSMLEHDWQKWLDDLNEGSVGFPDRLEVLYPDTELGQPRILGYFGMGDRYWLIPPDKKSDLIALPYLHSEPMETLDFSNFLFDDHDMSESSDIETQVISSGGMSASSSGIIHDPYSVYYSTDFFDRLGDGNPVGEAMRGAVNNIVPRNPLSFIDILLDPVELPNLYFKTKYERILLGDPAYSPVEVSGQQEGDVFSIRPHNSYLATASIGSDYVIKRGKLYVDNADEYLLESGKPVIPVFVREIILPKGSYIKDLNFRGFYRTYRYLKPQILPWDEHYKEEGGFSGRYPEEKYWYRNNTLLDGRILVRIYVPAVMYSERRSRVLKWGRISVEYEAPVEIMIKTRDIRLGLTEDIGVKVSNSGEEAMSGKLWVWVGGEDFSREVSLDPGQTREEVFQFTPEEAGDYQVKALFDSAPSSGLRYADFSVTKPCRWSCKGMPFWVRNMLRFGCKHECCSSSGWLSSLI